MTFCITRTASQQTHRTLNLSTCTRRRACITPATTSPTRPSRPTNTRTAFPELAKVNAENEIEFEPSPWESYTYDANDLAPISKDADTGVPLTGRAPASHHYTPGSTLLDGLGRVICTVQRNGSDPTKDWYVTRSRYDIHGNVLEVIDALGRSAFKHAYDLLNRPLRVESIDAGLRTSVLDAQGNLIEYRDSKGSIVLRECDELNRLIHLWAIDDANAAQQLTLREKIVYSDRANLADAAVRNLLGKPYIHYDEAGKLTFDRYDFKGNLTQKARRVVKDQVIASGWMADWQGEPPNQSDLEPPASAYETSTTFDALNRPTTITYPKRHQRSSCEADPHLQPRWCPGGSQARQ
jgi:hypothetical protein